MLRLVTYLSPSIPSAFFELVAEELRGGAVGEGGVPGPGGGGSRAVLARRRGCRLRLLALLPVPECGLAGRRSVAAARSQRCTSGRATRLLRGCRRARRIVHRYIRGVARHAVGV